MLTIPVLLGLFSLQATPENALKKAVARYEAELRELEESMVELGPAALAALRKIRENKEGDLRAAADRSIARIEENRPRMEEWVKNLGAPAVEKREEAQTALLRAGRAARPYLEEASKSEDRELATRAQATLERLKSSTPSPPAREVTVVDESGPRPKGVVVAQEPPPPRAEVLPVAPTPNHVWVAGYWYWNGKAFVWIAGSWLPRPKPGAVWVAGYWTKAKEAEGYVWVPGYWK